MSHLRTSRARRALPVVAAALASATACGDSGSAVCDEAACRAGGVACCPGGAPGVWNPVLGLCVCGGADADADDSTTDSADADATTDGVPPGCGDGRVEGAEECDDGNDVAADRCEADCTFSCRAAADCDDGNACTLDDCGDVAGGRACSHTDDDGAACDDGDPCTDADICTAGSCSGTTGCSRSVGVAADGRARICLGGTDCDAAAGSCTTVNAPGDWTDWEPTSNPMTRCADGTWVFVSEPLGAGRYCYKFAANGTTWFADPGPGADCGFGPEYCDPTGAFDNCRFTVP